MYIKKVENNQDIHAIAALAQVIWHEHFTPIIGEEQVLYMLDKFQSYHAIKRVIEEEGYCYYMAFSDDHQLMGYLGVHPEEDSVFVSKLYVEKSFRGQKISRNLLERLKADYPEKHTLWLTVNKHNTGTIEKYKHMGFAITELLETDIGDGFIMDDYIMKLTY